MSARKRIFMPVLIVTLLILLLGLIGWLAFRFFGMVAQRAMPLEPYYAITTDGVQRVSARIPTTRHDILLSDGTLQAEVDPGTGRVLDQPSQTSGTLAPAVCTGYERAIRERAAWPNPLTHVSAIQPDRVVVHIQPPLEDSP